MKRAKQLGPAYARRLTRHLTRQRAVEELFDLFDAAITTVLPCHCRRCVKYCKRCAELMARLETAVRAKPWAVRRDSLFPPRETAWTTVWIVE
jgi:hypothetical protein